MWLQESWSELFVQQLPRLWRAFSLTDEVAEL